MSDEIRFLRVAGAARDLRRWVGFLGGRLRAPRRPSRHHQVKIEELVYMIRRSREILRKRLRAA